VDFCCLSTGEGVHEAGQRQCVPLGGRGRLNKGFARVQVGVQVEVGLSREKRDNIMSTEIPEKCPKCGAGLKEYWENVYKCESVFHPSGPLAGTLEERDWCFKRQRDFLTKRVAELEEALRLIANMDYRGNRSTESLVALEALKAKGQP
jgi:hypothetical protein